MNLIYFTSQVISNVMPFSLLTLGSLECSLSHQLVKKKGQIWRALLPKIYSLSDISVEHMMEFDSYNT